jgi:hypothetical protein
MRGLAPSIRTPCPPVKPPHDIAFMGRLFRAAYALPALVLNRVARPEMLVRELRNRCMDRV